MPLIIDPQGIPLSIIAEKVKGQLQGDPAARVSRLCPIERPEAAGLSFVRPGSRPGDLAPLIDRGLAAIFCTPGDAASLPGINIILVNNPLAAFVEIVPLFYVPYPADFGISEKASISPTAKIGANVRIGPFCWIGDSAIIGDNTILHANVNIYPGARIGASCEVHAGVCIREDCVIGAGCIIHNGSIVGADGFGYYPDPAKGLVKVPQIGTVVIEDHVEIGANSCIDRATMGETRIGANTKIDNHVQIGHNNRIGSNSIICGCVGIAGSCDIGNQVVLGGGTGVADHVKIADGCRVAGNSGITSDLLEKADYAGFPPSRAFDWKRQVAAIRKLPSLIRKLEKIVKEDFDQ